MVVVEMKKHFQLRAIEWWSAATVLCWGAYVLLHPAMFTSNPAFEGMMRLAPQHIWGFFSFVAGIIRLCALTVNGFWYRTPVIRLATSFGGVFIWFWITVGFILTGLENTAIVVYAWLMVADIYSAYRSAIDTVEAEAQRRLKLAADGESSNVHSIAGR